MVVRKREEKKRKITGHIRYDTIRRQMMFHRGRFTDGHLHENRRATHMQGAGYQWTPVKAFAKVESGHTIEGSLSIFRISPML